MAKKPAAPKLAPAAAILPARPLSFIEEDNGNEKKIADPAQEARKWASKFISAEAETTSDSFAKVFNAMKKANLPKEVWERCASLYRRYPTYGWVEAKSPPSFSRKVDAADYIHDTFFRDTIAKQAADYAKAEADRAAADKKAAAKAKRDAKKAAAADEDEPAKKKAAKKASVKGKAKAAPKKAAKTKAAKKATKPKAKAAKKAVPKKAAKKAPAKSKAKAKAKKKSK